MPLTPGARLGHYEVVGLLGVGGMGEVYRATDTRLQRQVALKVLPDPVALQPERLARFEREAQLLASLNHPNIANIHGIEDDQPDATPGARHLRALVLELVEGPTLAERLVHGPLTVHEALPIARQIADAVDAAHQQGVVHRDLKPGNVKLRPDGTVKVLDFGLAKLVETAPGAAQDRDGRPHSELTQSPTITSPAMTRFRQGYGDAGTQMGVILGTAAYMSPEQARGMAVDRSTDIWAFGCIVFEMLTGARAFGGGDVTETIAAIVRAEPEWARLPHETPASVRRLLRRCLEKDRRRRLADIRDARLEIDDAEHEPTHPTGERTARGLRRERFAWSAVVLLLLVIAVAALARVRTGEPSLPSSEVRLDIATPPTTDPVSFDISPDGRHVVFVASSNGQPRLWLRPVASDAARPLPGTEGASFPFWSPDSRSVGFFSAERLMKLDIDGGAPVPIAFAPVGGGGAWGRNGILLFPTVPDAPLFQVSAAGGAPRPVPGSQPVGGERYPQWLPDDRHFLYYVAESRGVFLGRLDGPERRRLLDADAAAVFAAPGQLLFVLNGTLFSQAFDVERLELVGERSPLAEEVAVDRSRGKAAVAASSNGVVVYRTGASDQRRQLVWMDRRGTMRERVGDPDPANPLNPALSRDGSRLALSRTLEGNTDIWLSEVGRTGFTRLTFASQPEIVPLWSPDGASVLFTRLGIPGASMVVQSVSGAGAGEAVADWGGPNVGGIPLDWSRDGRLVLFRVRDSANGWDIWALDRTGRDEPMPIVRTPFDDRTAQLSPDGRWMLLESNDSGRFEVYLQPFPAGDRSLVSATGGSATGGSQPRWRADGREIFYVAPDGSLMAVPVNASSDRKHMDVGTPERLFQAAVEGTVQGGITHTYVPSRDGQRFLLTTFVEQAGTPLTVLLRQGAR